MIKANELNNRAITSEQTRKDTPLRAVTIPKLPPPVPSLFTEDDEKRVQERATKDEK